MADQTQGPTRRVAVGEGRELGEWETPLGRPDGCANTRLTRPKRQPIRYYERSTLRYAAHPAT